MTDITQSCSGRYSNIVDEGGFELQNRIDILHIGKTHKEIPYKKCCIREIELYYSLMVL